MVNSALHANQSNGAFHGLYRRTTLPAEGDRADATLKGNHEDDKDLSEWQAYWQSHWQEMKPHPGNRPIREANLNQKRKSLRDFGYKPFFPVIANPAGEIVGGQHKWTVCCELNIVPTILIVNNTTALEILELERYTTPHTQLEKYGIRSFNGDRAAKIVLDLCAEFNATPNVINRALHRTDSVKGDIILDSRIQEAQKILTEMRCLLTCVTEGRLYHTHVLIAAYMKLRSIEGFSHKIMTARCRKYNGLYVDYYNSDDQLENFIDIYNCYTPERLCLPRPKRNKRKS